MQRLLPWLPWRGEREDYLRRVRELVSQAADKALAQSELPAQMHPLFRRLAAATTWQESCWRQFVRSKDQATYLLSYNRSSVGLMQVNTRVWRQIYHPEHLRWGHCLQCPGRLRDSGHLSATARPGPARTAPRGAGRAVGPRRLCHVQWWAQPGAALFGASAQKTPLSERSAVLGEISLGRAGQLRPGPGLPGPLSRAGRGES